MKTLTDPASTQSPKDLVDDLKALVTEAEALVAGAQSENSTGVLRNLRARFGIARDRCAGLYDDTRQKVAAGARQADTSIRENPYQALAIGVGVAVLVGVMLGRRR